MMNLTQIKSALFIPANRNDFIAKAHSRGADAIILDLEDSVVEECKSEARDNIAKASALLVDQRLIVMVRLNGDTQHEDLDLQASVTGNVSCLLIPKVINAKQVQGIAAKVSKIEQEKGLPEGQVKLLAFIESAQGLINVEAIASASSSLLGMSLGTEDFSASIGSVANSEMLFHPCQRIVFASKAAGIVPFGFIGSIADYSDLEIFRDVIRRSKEMGFRGACCIHPSQVAIMNEEFAPSKEEVANAKGIVDCFEEAKKRGLGAVAYKGQMVDAPVYTQALAVLDQSIG